MTPEQRDAAIARNRADASYGSRRSFEPRNRIIPPDPDWPLPFCRRWTGCEHPAGHDGVCRRRVAPDSLNVRRCTTYDPATGECRCPR